MMGLTRGEYMRQFDRMNLLPYFPGKCKRDDKFPMTPAKLAATVIKPLLSGRVVIMVGRNVAQAFQLEADFHDWVDWPVKRHCTVQREPGVARVAIVPHPSGRNHWYNKDENMAESAAFWADFFDEDSTSRKVLSFPSRESIERLVNRPG